MKTNAFRQLASSIATLPRRILKTFGWGTQSPSGSYSDADELEAERRHERETWRQGVAEDDPAPPPS
jgi:hypothetical protein